MSLHNANLVAQPLGNLENTHSCACQQARKGVSHDMGRHPLAFLAFHIGAEGKSEVPSIDVFSARLDIGVQHVALRVIGPVMCGEVFLEACCERNGALLAVFESDAPVFSQMQQAAIKIKPEAAGLHDLVKAHASVESAKQNKFQILAGALLNQFVAQRGDAEILPCHDIWAADARRRLSIGKGLHGIRCAKPLGVLRPMEKSLKGHEIPVGGCFHYFLAALPLKACRMPSADRLGANLARGHAPTVFRPFFQHIALAPLRGQGPLPTLHTKTNIPIHNMNQNISAFQDGIVFQFPCPRNRNRNIVGLQGDKIAFPRDHFGEPINIPAKVDSFYGRSRGRGFHTKNCNTFTVTNQFFTRSHMGRYGFEGGTRNREFSPLCSSIARTKKTRGTSVSGVLRGSVPFEKGSGAYGARTRNLCRDRTAKYWACNTFVVTNKGGAQ